MLFWSGHAELSSIVTFTKSRNIRQVILGKAPQRVIQIKKHEQGGGGSGGGRRLDHGGRPGAR